MRRASASLILALAAISHALLAAAQADPIAPNHTGLWWNPEESGWGVSFAHQGDIVFATLFTYDTDGMPMWLVMSDGRREALPSFPICATCPASEIYSGALYRTTGAPFDGSAPHATVSTEVGRMRVSFADDSATLVYDVNGVPVSKLVRKLVFGSRPANCRPTWAPRENAENYQDLWWNPSRSGWGLSITHQDATLFATLFTYGTDQRGTWFVMSAGTRRSDGSYSGDLFRTRGPAFNAQPFLPLRPGDMVAVGQMTLRFTNGANGVLEYDVNGTRVAEPITRLLFSQPAAQCSS